MAKLINAKCPNCGAILELPETLDRAFCIHCGGKVIIAKDEVHHHYGAKAAIACPECGGVGYHPCTNCDGNGICNWVMTVSDFRRKFNYDGTWGSAALHKEFSRCINGRCKRCKGTGRLSLWKWITFEKKHICGCCDGKGICPQCKGTGKCSCNGTGKIKCKPCNGTGFKVYEGG